MGLFSSYNERQLKKVGKIVDKTEALEQTFSVMSDAELKEYVDILAHLLASAVQLLDPDAVIMGGGVCAMSAFPRELLLERLAQLCMAPVPASTLNLLYPVVSDASGVYGAAVFAQNSLIL